MQGEFVDAVEQMIPTLQRFAHSLARNPADADDLLQDTMERALTRSHQFEAGTNLKAWLFTIMRNRFYTECRRKQRMRDHAEERRLDAADVGEGTTGGQVARIETREFARAFAMLRADERSLLVMATVEELPYDTISQILEVEVGTVKSRVSRVRAKLRRIQEGEGDVALARVRLPAVPNRPLAFGVGAS